jgi:hypothetical protein
MLSLLSEHQRAQEEDKEEEEDPDALVTLEPRLILGNLGGLGFHVIFTDV